MLSNSTMSGYVGIIVQVFYDKFIHDEGEDNLPAHAAPTVGLKNRRGGSVTVDCGDCRLPRKDLRSRWNVVRPKVKSILQASRIVGRELHSEKEAPGEKLLPSSSLRSCLGDAEAIPKTLQEASDFRLQTANCKDL